jgi:FkbM family methyltransferase
MIEPLNLPPHIGLKQCKHGLFAYLMNDKFIGRALDYYGEYSEHETNFLMQLIKPGAVIIEVGANIGSLTVPLVKAVAPGGGFVFAYEPQRMSYQLLSTNIVLNGLRNVVTKQAAVGKQSGLVTYPEINEESSGNFGAIGVIETQFQTPFTTPMVRLDDEGVVPNLLKIDVEGMELDVILGAQKLLTQGRPALYVENDRPEKSADLVGALIMLGYQCHWHTPALFNRDNWRGRQDDLWPGIASFNMICVPIEAAISFQDKAITVDEAVHPALKAEVL